MTFRLAAAQALPFVFAGFFAASAAETGTPSPVTLIGTTEKICQLTGDIDWETGRPTAGRTLTNFGLGATDLGYPVEHRGKLILLFGDSRPPQHPPGSAPAVPPDDAVGITVRREPPNDDGKCLEMTVNEKPGGPKRFAPATIIGPVPVKQGFFNVPSGGVTGLDGLYAFFWTDHCIAPNPLEPSPSDPLRRPAPTPNCKETDAQNSIGRSVLARSEDDARTFSHVVPMPKGFVYATAINTGLLADLPEDQRLGIFIFGVPRYRASIPYLAHAPIASLANPATWQFFIGRAPDGNPVWVPHEAWMRGAPASGAGGLQAWKPPGEAEIFVPAEPAEQCIGEFSITWNRPLGKWLMLYQCHHKVWARIAAAPWGPWAAPEAILDAERLRCRMLMSIRGCGSRRNFWPVKKDGKFVPGGIYAPYVLNRYTRPAGGSGRRATIYWVVSAWNPYEVSVMGTTLQSDTP
ncbi:MAG: DUF4185 domain-containing protein [Rhodomicrobium sp.]